MSGATNAICLPLIATFVVLGILFLISPAIWITGAIFARNGQRAFFLSGLLCGLAPFICLAVPILWIGYSFLVSLFDGSGIASISELNQNGDELQIRALALGAWLFPGFFAMLGGGVGWFVHRSLTRTEAKPSISLSDYRVIEARISPMRSDAHDA